MTVIYTKFLGDGQVELIHSPTNSKIITDLPPDNGGKGRMFSPTDLFTSSLSSCILTIMGNVAQRDNIDIVGAKIEIEKEMAQNPRRISKLHGKISFPKHLADAQKNKLMQVVKACPVHNSLREDIEVKFDLVD